MFVPHRVHTYGPLRSVTEITLLFLRVMNIYLCHSPPLLQIPTFQYVGFVRVFSILLSSTSEAVMFENYANCHYKELKKIVNIRIRRTGKKPTR
jgi:hypothetical protein